MPKPGEAKPIWGTIAIVKAVSAENRHVDVKYVGSDRGKSSVVVVTDPGSLSFPKVGDYVLIISVDEVDYCLGKVEYQFATKLEEADPKPRKVEGGETFLTNLAKRTWLYLANSGNFSLMNGLNDGLKYFSKSRVLRLAGYALSLVGFGTRINFGSVTRNIPGAGSTTIPSDVVTIPAVEALIDLTVNKIPVALFHIGQIFTNTATPAPIPSSWGGRLRALLQVFNAGGLPAASLQMDEVGNVELSSLLANVMLNGLSIQLGGITATEPVMRGTSYTAAETTFLTAVQTFCTVIESAFAVGVGSSAQNAAVLTAINGASGALKAAASTFSGALAGTLSPITKTV